ncbi:MAG TPA: hypothetical protein VH325_07215 [Bryobacteraceae bacterium]|nr:hypothetical protein [Bryobacteraceae bacterium]
MSILKAVTSELKPENPIQATLVSKCWLFTPWRWIWRVGRPGQIQINTTMATLGHMERLLRLYVDQAEAQEQLAMGNRIVREYRSYLNGLRGR